MRPTSFSLEELLFKKKKKGLSSKPQESWREGEDFSYIPARAWSPPVSTLEHLLQLTNLHWHIIINQSPSFTYGLTFGGAHPVGLDECVMICVCHYGISIFAVLKVCALFIYLFIPSPPRTAPDSHWSTASIVLPSPEHCIVVIIQDVAFSDWLLSLSNMHLRFLSLFSWLIVHVFLILSDSPSSEYTVVYLYIHLPKGILVAFKF